MDSKKPAPVIFEKSKSQAFLQSLIEAVTPICLGSIMSCVLFAYSEASSVLSAVGVFILIISALMTAGALWETIVYARSERGWRVDIADGVLNWSSPTPKLGTSFRVALADIKQVRLEVFEKIGSEISPETSYFIDLKSGESFQVGQKSASVRPEEVFAELAKQGVVFIRAINRTQNGRQRKRTEEKVFR